MSKAIHINNQARINKKCALSHDKVYFKEPCMYHKRGHEDFLSVVSDCPWMAPSLAVEKQKQIAAAQHGLALSVKTIQRVAL